MLKSILSKIFRSKKESNNNQTPIEDEQIPKKKKSPFKIGDRVISRSNQDIPLMIGTVTGFDNFENPRNDDFPIVKCEKTNKEYICLSILRPYSEQLLKELEGKNPKEQWNYLAKPCNQKL